MTRDFTVSRGDGDNFVSCACRTRSLVRNTHDLVFTGVRSALARARHLCDLAANSFNSRATATEAAATAATAHTLPGHSTVRARSLYPNKRSGARSELPATAVPPQTSTAGTAASSSTQTQTQTTSTSTSGNEHRNDTEHIAYEYVCVCVLHVWLSRLPRRFPLLFDGYNLSFLREMQSIRVVHVFAVTWDLLTANLVENPHSPTPSERSSERANITEYRVYSAK